MVATAYGYIRFSSASQAEGDSRSRQQRLHQAFAEKHGLNLVMLPPDEAVSAKDGNNLRQGSLAQFINDVSAGKIAFGSWLLIEDFDRFSRAKASVAYEKFLGLINAGIVIATTRDGNTCRDGDHLVAFMIPLIKLEGAHEENFKRGERVRKAAAERRQAATRDNPMTARVPLWLKVVRSGAGRRIVENEAHADIVREIFAMAERGLGNGSIAATLNQRDVAPFSGGKGWHKTYVQKLLTNRAVLGEYQPHETSKTADLSGDLRGDKRRRPIGEPKLEYYPQIIDFDLWRRVQAARQVRAKTRTGRPSRSNVNIFAGLCRCGHCGGTMELRVKGSDSGGDYLTCASSLRKAGCTARYNYSLRRLQSVFLDQVIGFLMRLDDFGSPNEAVEELSAQLNQVSQNIEIKRARINNLSNAVAESDSAAVRRPLVARLEAEQKELDQLIVTQNSLNREIETATAADPERAFKAMEDLIREVTFEDADARLRMGQLLRSVVRDVTFMEGRVNFAPSRDAPPVKFDEHRPPDAVKRPARSIVVDISRPGRATVKISGLGQKNINS